MQYKHGALSYMNHRQNISSKKCSDVQLLYDSLLHIDYSSS